jgi:biopolymer transport protein ExbD
MNSRLKAFHFATQPENDTFGLGFSALLDLCIIVGLFVWLSSRFTFSPGIPIDLPQSELELQGIPCAAVLTVAGKDALFLEGDRFKLNDIAPALRTLVEREKGSVSLLLKMNKSSNMATFLSICEIAQANGIQSVQIATGSTNKGSPQN